MGPGRAFLACYDRLDPAFHSAAPPTHLLVIPHNDQRISGPFARLFRAGKKHRLPHPARQDQLSISGRDVTLTRRQRRRRRACSSHTSLLVPTAEPIVAPEPTGQRPAFPSRLENAACWFGRGRRRRQTILIPGIQSTAPRIVLSSKSAIRQDGGRTAGSRRSGSGNPQLRGEEPGRVRSRQCRTPDRRRHNCRAHRHPA